MKSDMRLILIDKTYSLKKIFLFILLGISLSAIAQKANLKGQVFDKNNKPVAQVNILIESSGTTTDADGRFEYHIPADKKIKITFSHVNYHTKSIKIKLKANENKSVVIQLESKTEQIKEVVVVGRSNKEKEGGVKVGQTNAVLMPGAQAGVENLIKSLPSASGQDDLSSQYMVRGGNFDENQVYINEIEVYRPFLIRSGQQEGLSFVNSDLVSNIFFFPGGFSATQGDKLSSVLDITYKNPKKNQTDASFSLLGGGISNEYKNKKFGSLLGLRYRNNALLVNGRQTQVDYHPVFADIQSLLKYDFNTKLSIEFLGNISLNLYNYKPIIKQTNFGSYQDSKVVVVNYHGQEKDNYKTFFGAFKGTYKASKKLKYTLVASLYNTQEEEYFDILSGYNIGEANTDIGSDDFGNPQNLESLGEELNHARNDLDALIGNMEFKLKKIFGKNSIETGIKMSFEDIKDRLNEWQVIDSAGFSLYPRNLFNIEEPYDLDATPILPYQKIKSYNHALIQRYIAYASLRKKFKIGTHQLWTNIGVRGQFWEINDKMKNNLHHDYVISPRFLLGIKPDWKNNMEFRLATGVYQQPPFYREFRDSIGKLKPEVKAQKSYIVSLANDWYFEIWKRPFKLTSEAYYKYLWDVNPYTLENVRIRYQAKNNATAFAYGFETRLNGEFIPGVESWFSLGYMKTKENLNNRGYIYRPTDQRLKFAMLFQDYVPRIPNIRMYLNMVFNTGLIAGSPSYADPYDYQFRTGNYFRTDLGIFYILTDKKQKPRWVDKFKHISFGFEILNLFDVQNSISNMWVRDIYSKHQYRVKNYLTGRLFNVKLNVKF